MEAWPKGSLTAVILRHGFYGQTLVDGGGPAAIRYRFLAV